MRTTQFTLFLRTCSLAIIIALMIPFSLFAQQRKSKKNSYAVVVKARSQKDRILLRWAINEPAAWKLANKYGYIVERFTVLINGKLNSARKKILLTPTPLKPKPEKDWLSIIQINDDAAIIAQSLYGESFKVGAGDVGMAKIINQSNELDQRFSFSLLAADRSFDAAQMAGWGLVDSTVKKGEKYLYRIYTAVPNTILKIDSAGAYVGLEDYQPLPQPKDLYAAFGDKAVLLTWNYILLKDIYSTYYIERSEDSIHFKKLSDLPVANLNESDGNKPSKIFYTDTLETNNKNYTYRIKGLTSFGEIGPPSATVNGFGKLMLAFVPNINTADIVNDSTANIEWQFAEEGNILLDHFELDLSTTANENSFKTVRTNILPAERKISYNKLLPTNYFAITAVDKYGNKRTSFPFLVQPVDSTPPAVPVNLSAVIDTLGNVTLKWKANEEPDLLGYTILKGNIKTEEGAVLNSEPYTKNIFKEKINLKTLNAKVYYAIIAIDQRMNQSKASPFIELIKPDKIPPTTPIFSDYKITEDGKVHLYWINSSSDDVASSQLYRKKINEKEWQLIKKFESNNIDNFLEDSLENGQTYSYTLIAIDKSNNESQPSPPLTVTVNNSQKIPAVKNLKATVDKLSKSILITWSFDNKDVVEFTIYKGVNKAPLTTWKVVDAKQTSASDTELLINNVYRYAVRAILKDGRMSGWKEVKVEY